MSKRSYIRVPSREGKILRHMRLKAGLSMRQAASRVGISASMISHIEIGRENLPPGRLDSIVRAYGHTVTQFNDYMRAKSVPVNIRDECIELIRVIDDLNLQPIHLMITSLMQQGARK